MFGVETHSFLPNDQSDGRDLARQSESRHRWLHPSRYETDVELLKRSTDGSSPSRRTLEDIFQIVIVVGVEPANNQEFLGAFQLALYDSVFPARGGFQCQTTVGPQLPLGAISRSPSSHAGWRTPTGSERVIIAPPAGPSEIFTAPPCAFTTASTKAR